MSQNNGVLEVVSDSFYVKKELDCNQCKFAYLHLAEDARDIYLACFENSKVEEPSVFWWEEDNRSKWDKSRDIIIEFIGEAYLSLYIKEGLEKQTEKPLWKHTSCINCGIPPKWWDKVNNIKR